MIKNIIFDFDGTLFDTSEGIEYCLNYTLNKKGRIEAANKNMNSIIGRPLFEVFRFLLPDEDDNFLKECAKIFRKEYKKNLLIIKPFKNVKKLLLQLRRDGKKTVIVSNKPKSYIKKILQAFSLLEFFDYIEAPKINDFIYSKNDLLKSTIKKLGLRRKETIMIGDRAEDVLVAKLNKIKSIGVTFGFGSRRELEEAGADLIIDKIDLKQISSFYIGY